MKIASILPYKENFSPEYPGAVSLFVYETTKISKYKKDITIFGNTEFKKKFNLNYENIFLKKSLFSSQTRNYVSQFIKLLYQILINARQTGIFFSRLALLKCSSILFAPLRNFSKFS